MNTSTLKATMLLLLCFVQALVFAQNNSDFYLAPNGETCMCPDADFGDTGTLTINGVEKTFTKRSRAELEDLIRMMGFEEIDEQISLTCTSGITDMSSLFSGRFYYTFEFNIDLSTWDVSAVTDMSRMFQYAQNFNQPLNNWNVSAVKNMSEMFIYAENFNQPLDNWDVSAVTDMSEMFIYAENFNQPLDNWDVSAVTDMSGMFVYSKNFNQPLENWDVSAVTNMGGMFSSAVSFDQPIGNWDVSAVTNMGGMFSRADSFNQPIENWDVSAVTNMASMFSRADSFNEPLDNWDVSAVTNMNRMFVEAKNFNQNLETWNFNTEVALDDFISYSGMDSSSYDALLQSFLSQTLVNKTLGADLVAYCDDDTRTELLQTKSWQIKGDISGSCGEALSPSTTPFVTTWRVTEDDLEINLYTNPIYDYNYTVDWGDGTTSSDLVGDTSHVYSQAGEYTVSILGVLPSFSVCEYKSDFCANANQLLEVSAWGDQEWRLMALMFEGTNNLSFTATDVPDLTQVSSMQLMFNSASNFNSNISNWDVSNVTDMTGMFSNASSFNQPLGNWDVSAVINMGDMFARAEAFDQDINSWNVGNVTSMSGMFSVATQFNQPLNNWDVSAVSDMSGMFFYAENFNQPLDSWDVSNVVTMTSMFSVASGFNQPLNSWDVSKVVSMISMFSNATSFNQPLNNWDVSNVRAMIQMFSKATSFNQPLDNWDVSNVEDMRNMFSDAVQFNQDISGWCLELIVSEPDGFSRNSALQASYKPSWDCNPNFYLAPNGVTCMCPNAAIGETGTLIINNVEQTFTKRSRAQLDDLISADEMNSQIALTCTSGITDMSYMFFNAKSFNQPLDNWDVSAVTDMNYMFFNAENFNQPLDNWDVSAVTNTSFMFSSAVSFNETLGSWNVGAVTNMSDMFYEAENFNQPLNNWDVSNVTSMYAMFDSAYSFNQPLDNWDVTNVADMRYMFSDAVQFNQDISGWCVEQIATEARDFSRNSALQASYKPNWGSECSSLSLTEKDGVAIALYPNPSTDVVYINNQGGTSLERLVIYDMTGRLVKSQQLSSLPTTSIDVSDLSSGSYVVQIITSAQLSLTKRLIIK